MNFIVLSKKIYSVVAIIYVAMLLHYSLTMWESKQKYGILFLSLSMILLILKYVNREKILNLKGKIKNIVILFLLFITAFCGTYFWLEYPSLVWERAGALTALDENVSLVMICMVIILTWLSTGALIPSVSLFFIAYALFGHWLPEGTLFYHAPISIRRFAEIAAGEMSGIFGTLNQIGSTWIAIFTFFAGFVQGFGGLDYVLKLNMHLFSKRSRLIPQIAVLSSMAFGGMSGSAGANAASTGAFTIPLMKRFKLPAAVAGSVEAVSSSGGQIMPPILGAVAFIMCDYLNMHYYQILLASLFPSIIFFGSTIVSVGFIANKFIDPNLKIEDPIVKSSKNFSIKDYFEGLPILISFVALMVIFIVYQVNILTGGFYTIIVFLLSRFIYDLIVAKGSPKFLWRYITNLYKGVEIGVGMILPIAVMLATLGIVLKVLTGTALAEKLAYIMVSTVGSNFYLLLFFTMIICIVFGMAVSTTAAYIIVVSLAAPALIDVGVPVLVSHFVVFYWAMLSAITPPVASVCVITASISNSSYLSNCWESMKLGFPKFILPLVFITQPEILEFNFLGFQHFIVAFVGFIGISAGIQSGYGVLPQAILMCLGLITIFIKSVTLSILPMVVTILVLIFYIRKRPQKFVRSKDLNII